jgi:O-antigen ligase
MSARGGIGWLPVLKWPAIWIILGFLLVVARFHELYPPLARLKPVLATVVAATLATILARRVPGERAIPFGDLTLTLLLCYWGWMFMTVPMSIYRGMSLQFAIDQAPVMLFTAVLLSQRASIAQLRTISLGFLVVCGIYGAALILFGQQLYDVGGTRYYLSESLDPNDAAGLLAMGAPFALANTRRSENRKTRMASWLMFGVICFAVIRTSSRGGVIALMIGVGLVLVSSRGLRAIISSVAILALLSIGWQFVPPSLAGRFAVLGNSQEDYNMTSRDGRIGVWKRGISYFAEKPVFGVGVGAFPIREGEQLRAEGNSGKWSAAHNSYIQAFAEQGFVGGSLFCLLLFATMWRVSAVFRVPSRVTGMSHPEYLAALGAFAGSGMFLSHAYFWGFFALVALCGLAARTLAPSNASAVRQPYAPQGGRAR